MEDHKNMTNEQYQHLVDEIHNLQKAIDRRFPRDVGSRPVIGDIHAIFSQELQIMARKHAGEPENDELTELILDTESSRTHLVSYLRASANSLDPSLSTDFDIPVAGSDEWYGIYVYSGILSESYCRVEFPSEAKDPNPKKAEENTPECRICAQKYEEGDRDVTFPCDFSHRLCTECFKSCVHRSSALGLQCPYCKTSPWLESDSHMFSNPHLINEILR